MNAEQLENAKDMNVNFNDETMTAYEMARWLSLIEGIDVVSKAAVRMNIDLEHYDKWVKPLAFQKYIGERTYGMIADVINNEEEV